MTPPTFTNAAGVAIELRALSPWILDGLAPGLERDWLARGLDKPTPPTYQLTTATGATETHAHDLTTLKTDADKAAWAEWEARRAQWNREINQRSIRLIYSEGVVSRPADDSWLARHEFLGLPVPTDPFERQVYWVKNVAITCQADAQGIINAVYQLSGISTEALRSAEDAFRSQVEGAGRDAAGAAQTPAR